MPESDAWRFAEPAWLWLLALPLLLAGLWTWQLARRLTDLRRLTRQRRVPFRQRLPLFGDLLVWLALLGALASVCLALARPQAIVSRGRTTGADIVILQDGSASMRVADVPGDRWRRSMRFLRVLGESLRWERDRLALALFAQIATPQIRLTRDPNTFFFFLDHLQEAPPFRLQDAGTWDTNIARGVVWGLRLVEKDEEVLGASGNARAFVLISDGQDWSTETAAAIGRAQARGIPVHVIGVGTTAGGLIPASAATKAGDAANFVSAANAANATNTANTTSPTNTTSGAGTVGTGTTAASAVPGATSTPLEADARGPALHSSLDRDSLAAIAQAAGGRYFELDRESDAAIAHTIIDLTRRRAPAGTSPPPMEEQVQELYWWALAAAAGWLLAGLLAQRDRAALVLQAGAAALAALVLLRVIG